MSVKKPLAVVATAAMVVSGAAFGSAAAQADPDAPAESTTVYVPAQTIVGPDQAGESEVYNQWHFGPKDGEPLRVKSAKQERNGLIVEAGTEAQIIKGNGHDSDVPGNEDVKGLLESLRVVASDNSALTYQVGVRVKDETEDKGWKGWSTLRAEVSNPDKWTSSKVICGVPADVPTDLKAFLDGCGDSLYTISTGVLVYRPANDVLVSSFTAGDTTTKFYEQPAEASVGTGSTNYVDAKDIRPNEDTYAGWHNGDKSGAEAYETVAGEKGATLGLKVTGKTQILNGFAEADFQVNAAKFAAEMQIDVVDGEVWAQVPVFAYPEGAQKEVFTTLRALVPESGNLSEATEWVSSKQVGSLAANTATDFETVLAAIGDHDVIGYGFFVDTDKVATVKSITFNGATTDFAKEATPEEPGDGDDQGAADGDDQGAADGDDQGAADGDDQGAADGDDQGAADGNDQGAADGNDQGAADGDDQGAADGDDQGAADGDDQGDSDGNGDGNTKPNKPGVELSDITKTTKFSKEITWLAETGITTGYKQADGTYKFMPKNAVTREAMAAFLYRLAPAEDKKGFKAPKVSPFADLKPGDHFYKEITWAHSAGLTKGWKQASGLPKFQPKANIDRGAIAAFMFRQHAPKNYKATGASPFGDMKPGDQFYKEIHWMGKTGLSTGNKLKPGQTGKPTYLPKDSTTREAMAAFLYRADQKLK